MCERCREFRCGRQTLPDSHFDEMVPSKRRAAGTDFAVLTASDARMLHADKLNSSFPERAEFSENGRCTFFDWRSHLAEFWWQYRSCRFERVCHDKIKRFDFFGIRIHDGVCPNLYRDGRSAVIGRTKRFPRQ